MKLKMEPYKREIKGGSFNEWLVRTDSGEVVATVRKGKPARGYIFPWQAHLVPKGFESRSVFLGSWYEANPKIDPASLAKGNAATGGKKAMLAAIYDAVSKADDYKKAVSGVDQKACEKLNEGLRRSMK